MQGTGEDPLRLGRKRDTFLFHLVSERVLGPVSYTNIHSDLLKERQESGITLRLITDARQSLAARENRYRDFQKTHLSGPGTQKDWSFNVVSFIIYFCNKLKMYAVNPRVATKNSQRKRYNYPVSSEDGLSSKWYWNNWTSLCKMNIGPYLEPHIKLTKNVS